MAMSRSNAQRIREAMLVGGGGGGGKGGGDDVDGDATDFDNALAWFAGKYRTLEEPPPDSRAKVAHWVPHELMVQGASLHDASQRLNKFLEKRHGVDEETWEVIHIKTTKVESILIDGSMRRSIRRTDAGDGDDM